MKNKQGSILVVTLIIFAVLMVLGTFTLSLSATENKQALNHQHRTQAYYIARAGAEAVEAAILEMDDEEIDALMNKLSDGATNLDVNEIPIGIGTAHVSLSLDNEDDDNKTLIIKSLGKIKTKTGKDVNNTVTKVVGGSEEDNLEFAMFAIAGEVSSGGKDGDIAIDVGTSATVKGDVGTNGKINIQKPSTNPEGSKAVDGTLDIMKHVKVDQQALGLIARLRNTRTQPINYKFKFPEIPSNDSSDNLTINPRGNNTIKKNGKYKKIEIKNSGVLTIDASNNDIKLNIEDFIIAQGGLVKVKGTNKVTIYVKSIKWSEGSSIEYEDENQDSSLVDIYHHGDGKTDYYESRGNPDKVFEEGINISSNVDVKFNLYIKKADLHLRNSSSYKGSIFSAGKNITIHRQAKGGNKPEVGKPDGKEPGLFNGLIYAPNAHIVTAKGVDIHGVVICDTIDLGQWTWIIHDNTYISEEDMEKYIRPNIPTSSSRFKSGYYK